MRARREVATPTTRHPVITIASQAITTTTRPTSQPITTTENQAMSPPLTTLLLTRPHFNAHLHPLMRDVPCPGDVDTVRDRRGALAC